jgi:hypothetical protein
VWLFRGSACSTRMWRAWILCGEKSDLSERAATFTRASAYQMYALMLNLGNLVGVVHDHLVWLIRPLRLYLTMYLIRW